MVTHSFPSHYPEDCPPKPYDEMCGTYYRLVTNEDKSDINNFKSHYEANLMEKLETTKACSRRALSMFKKHEEAVILSKQFRKIGKYIAHLNLTGGHGVVCEENYCYFESHYNWWVPNGVNALDFCSHIEAIS